MMFWTASTLNSSTKNENTELKCRSTNMDRQETILVGGRVDALETAKVCIDAFEKDHNTEHLIDAANYLMFRYMYPYPGEYFKPTDSNGSVGTVGTPINMER